MREKPWFKTRSWLLTPQLKKSKWERDQTAMLAAKRLNRAESDKTMVYRPVNNCSVISDVVTSSQIDTFRLKVSTSLLSVQFKNECSTVLLYCLHVMSKRSKMSLTKTVTLTVCVNEWCIGGHFWTVYRAMYWSTIGQIVEWCIWWVFEHVGIFMEWFTRTRFSRQIRKKDRQTK